MPDPELAGGEKLITTITANRATYVKEHVLIAALGAVIMSGALMFMGNPHAWTGVVGSVLAVSVRGFYLASEQLGFVWHLTDRRLIRPDGLAIRLGDVDQVRTIFSAVQVITAAGDKYMLKYLADTAHVAEAIRGALK